VNCEGQGSLSTAAQFFFLFFFFGLVLLNYIFLFLHITKASSHLTPYQLKGKKGVCCLESSYRLKNYEGWMKLDQKAVDIKSYDLLISLTFFLPNHQFNFIPDISVCLTDTPSISKLVLPYLSF
jgi:hypothetical protein